MGRWFPSPCGGQRQDEVLVTLVWAVVVPWGCLDGAVPSEHPSRELKHTAHPYPFPTTEHNSPRP